MASRVRVPAAPAEEYDETEGNEEVKTERKSRVVTNGAFSSGWGAPKEEFRETVKAPYLRLKDNGKRIVKILEAKPFIEYREHFINSVKRGFTCMQETEWDPDTKRKVITVHCPLCDAGHWAGFKYKLNVVDMAEPKEVKTWTFGPEVRDRFMSILEEDMYNPIDQDKWYWKVYHVKVAGRVAPSTMVDVLRASDLQDYHNLEPLTSSEVETLQETLYGEDTVWIHSEKQLEKAAAGMTEKDTERGKKD